MISYHSALIHYFGGYIYLYQNKIFHYVDFLVFFYKNQNELGIFPPYTCRNHSLQILNETTVVDTSKMSLAISICLLWKDVLGTAVVL